MVRAMPVVLSVLSTVGIAAMLWVGGHILIVGANELGWHAPEEAMLELSRPAEHLHAFLGWLVETLCSALAGLGAGAAAVGVLHLLPKRRKAAH